MWAYGSGGTPLPKFSIGLRQSFGSGGSPSAAVDVNAVPITLTTTPTRYSVTFTLPSMAGKTLGTNGDSQTALRLWTSCGTGNAALAGNIGVQTGGLVLWGVQLK
jgi:hypothetical protein